MYEVPDLDSIESETTRPGYAIFYPMQLAWVRTDKSKEFYRARVYSDNYLMVTVPAADWDMIKGGDFEGSSLDPKIVGGINNARKHFRDHLKEEGGSKIRMWKTFLLRFPAGHKLNSKVIYEDAGEDQDLDVDFVKTYTNKAKSSFRYYACWKVANKQKKKFARGFEDNVEAEMSKNAKRLAELGLLDNSDEEDLGTGENKN